MEVEDYSLLWSRKIFIETISELMEFMCNKIDSYDHKDDDFIKQKKICKGINGEINKNINESEFDMERFIKRIYKTINNNLDKVSGDVLDKTLFSVTNADGKKIYIIPSVDIEIVYNICNEDEQKILWKHILLLYIQCIRMISLANKTKIENQVTDFVKQLEKKFIENIMSNLV